jgi:hypothetical protein
LRVKTIDEYVRRYVMSSAESAANLSRYWKQKGMGNSEAEQRALNQAIGMIVSGYGKDLNKAKSCLLELRGWCDRILLKIEPDCARCEFMPCLDLHRQDEIREDAGGEMHVLRSMLNAALGMAIYHNTGGMVGSIEDVLIGTIEMLPRNLSLTHMFLWYALKDLRASAFLAFCGRYKQAFSVLRSALELIFVGAYLQTLEDRGFREEHEKRWEEWWNGRNLFRDGLKATAIVGWLNQKMKDEAGRLWGSLSGTVHRLEKDEYEMVIEKGLERARPTSSFYHKSFLLEWFESLLKIVVIMRRIIAVLGFRHSDRSQRALYILDNIINALDTNKREPLPFVECPMLTSLPESH